MVLAESGVVAHDGALLAGAAEAELDRRFRADAGKKDGAVALTRDSGKTGIQGFVEKDADIGVGGRSSHARQKQY